MSNRLSNQIIRNFGGAAAQYNRDAQLQKNFAWHLALKCSEMKIPTGIWADLGTGTGLLADALEQLHPNQSVLRVDGSVEMLSQHQSTTQTQLWNLNLGLPKWSTRPTLIASCFALHWLNEPTNRLKEWINGLEQGGWVALALPIAGSFPEWHLASKNAGVSCSAHSFPSQSSLLQVIDSAKIRYQHIHKVTQQAKTVASLLKPFKQIGAHSSPHAPLSVRDWRKLYRAWPNSSSNKPLTLTWHIQLLIAQR